MNKQLPVESHSAELINAGLYLGNRTHCSLQGGSELVFGSQNPSSNRWRGQNGYGRTRFGLFRANSEYATPVNGQAASVLRFLSQQGIETRRFNATTLSESQPLKSHDTAQARSGNRRR